MFPVTHGRRRSVLPLPENAAAWRASVRVRRRGPVAGTVVDAVTRQLRSTFRVLPEQVLHARVKLSAITSPGATWPAVGQVNLDLRGRMVRAQVAAATPGELAELLASRLRSRLGREPEQQDARPHRCLAQLNHLAEVPPPDRERAVLRRKTCWLGRLTADQAVTELEDLDYDVHLFVERATGQDAVVYRAGDEYRLSLAEPVRCTPVEASVPLTVSRRCPPTLTVAAAKAQMEALGLPFLFFLDASTERGAVLYHRYDGHFGVITALV